MAYGFIEDVPANEEMYAQVRARIGETPPTGLIAHIAVKREGGLRYIDVWESKADWDRFHEEKADPAVAEMLATYGITPDPSMAHFEDMDLVHVWVPTAQAVPSA